MVRYKCLYEIKSLQLPFFFLWREKNLEKVSQNFEFRSHNYQYFLGILSSHLTIIIIFPPQKVIVTFLSPNSDFF